MYENKFHLTEEEKNAHPAVRPPPIVEPLMHPLKKNTHREYLRVSSVPRLPTYDALKEKLTPMTQNDVSRIKEEDL